jgi:LPS O-antigen subunit length determinant protein (WzzB/FepE family)
VDDEGRVARLLTLAARLWDRRKAIAAGTAAGALLAVAYALLAPEIFVSRAIIYPKEISATTERSLLGVGLGGVLNPLAGVSHLNRVDIVLKSPELATAVLRREGMLPLLFPDWWDPSAGRWKEGSPSEFDGLEALRRALFTRVDSYKLTLEIRVRAGDAKTAHGILRGYLDALNERMKEAVIRDADANREYLELQLSKTYDPWIREKIQQLILRQVETGMLLNANAFEVLEGPSYPRLRESPVRKRIVLLAASTAFALSCGGVLLAASGRGWRAAARRP